METIASKITNALSDQQLTTRELHAHIGGSVLKTRNAISTLEKTGHISRVPMSWKRADYKWQRTDKPLYHATDWMTRGRYSAIRRYLADNPGSTAGEIACDLGFSILSTQKILYHLYTLEINGVVSSRKRLGTKGPGAKPREYTLISSAVELT